jgi:signal transduction histidine kinase
LWLDFFLGFAYNKTKRNEMATRRRLGTKRTFEDLRSPVLQEILSGVEDELLVIDSDYRIMFANLAAQRKLDQESIPLGRLCYQALQGRDKPCNPPLWECPLRKVLDSGAKVDILHPLHNHLTTRYIKVTAFPLRDKLGNAKTIVEIRRDVTAERNLEMQIVRRHHQLLTLSHISSAVSILHNLDAVLRAALDDVLELISGAVGGILLLDEKTETLYYRVQRGLSPRYTEDRHIALGEGIAGRVAQSGEPMLVEDISQDPRAARPDLVSAEDVRGFVSIPLKARDKVVGVMNIFSHMAGRFGADDVSLLSSIGDYLGTAIEQAKLYERLERVGERYKILLQYALMAQEQERKRIARELHDETAQSITSLTLSLQAIIGMAGLKGFTDPDFLEKLKKTHSYAVNIGNEIVQLMKELRPTLLDELGLPAAIHRYGKDNLQSHGINVAFDFKGTDQRLPPEVEVTLFRIAQGAIGNILEHSEAKSASVKLHCNDAECTLIIADNGKGFDVSKLTSVDRSGRGAGLFIMRERTSLLGGSGYVESEPGKGTKLIAKVPLNWTVEDLAKELTNEKDTGIDS